MLNPEPERARSSATRKGGKGAWRERGLSRGMTGVTDMQIRVKQYNLVYGSLATLLGFMFWIYAVHMIVLFGAHLSAQAAGRPPGR